MVMYDMTGINFIHQSILKEKETLEKYLADTSISLNERWETFKAAPDWLGNHDIWITGVLDEAMGEISWYDDFYKERHEVVVMADIIETMEERAEVEGRYTKEQLVAAKEAILKHNLKSFVFDW